MCTTLRTTHVERLRRTENFYKKIAPTQVFQKLTFCLFMVKKPTLDETKKIVEKL